MKKVFIITCILTILCITTHSQANKGAYENLIPQLIESPNAASLNKFIEYPVNNFNGTVDVSFPLYEIKLNNLSIPITLKYHTGGIRVNEEASWVGLGWALSVGGQITRQVNGKDDLEGNINIFGEYFPFTDSDLNNSLEAAVGQSVFGANLPNADGEMEDFLTSFLDQGQNHDSEPDIYIYQIGNYSGKFIKDDIGNEVDLNYNQFKFKQFYNAGQVIGDSIIATAPDGNVYKFKDREMGYNIVGVIPAGHSIIDYTTPKTKTYLLTEIITPNGEQVKFKYKTFKDICYENGWENLYPDIASNSNGYYFNTPSLVESHIKTSIDTPNLCGTGYENTWADSKKRSYNFMIPLFLDKIEYAHGSVEFEHGIREDNYGVKLDRVNIRNINEEVIKYFNFNYDYFTGNTPVGSDVTSTTNFSTSYNFTYPLEYIVKRLKLVSFSENGSDELIHKFHYNEGTLPFKTSFEQDFWGYYNGRPNKTLLPSPRYSSYFKIPSSYNINRYVGANRDVDTAKVKACALREIIYPTGGKTVFEFEAHKVINSNISNITNLTNDVYITALDVGDVGYPATLSNPIVPFTLDETKNVVISIYLTDEANIYNSSECNGLSTFYVQIEKYSSTSGWNLYNRWCLLTSNDVLNIDVNDVLTSGMYRLTASYPPGNQGSLGSSMAQISVKYELENIETNSNYYVGGLRIKEIKHKESATTPFITTKYSYDNGVLATHPSYTYNYKFTYGGVNCSQQEGSKCTSPYLGIWNKILQRVSKENYSNSPVFPFSYSANGSLVGYRKVIEMKSKGQIGRAEYKYFMDSDNTTMSFSGLPGLPTTANLKNGLIESKKLYDSSNRLVKETNYEYTQLDPSIYWAFRLAPGIFEYNGDCGIVDWLTTYFYPIIKGKYVLKKVTDIEKYGENELISTTENSYSIPMLPYPTSIEKNIGDGRVVKKNIIYSPYYLNIWNELTPSQRDAYQELSNKNCIVPIQTSSYVDGVHVSSIRTTYKDWDLDTNKTLISPENVYVKNKNQQGYSPEITFSSYDLENGNISEYRKENGMTVSYLWGYNKQYPVAKVENATISDVEDALTSIELNNIKEGAYGQEEMILTLSKIRTALPHAMVNIYTYEPLVGLTSMTDSKGNTVYYEYDGLNRLKTSRDASKNILSEYLYHYKNKE